MSRPWTSCARSQRSTATSRRTSWLAIPIAVIKKFGDDQAGSLAALVAYYAFFSLFPLLLVFVTILGFVLQGDPQRPALDRELGAGQFPIIGHQIKSTALTRSR